MMVCLFIAFCVSFPALSSDHMFLPQDSDWFTASSGGPRGRGWGSSPLSPFQTCTYNNKVTKVIKYKT